MLQSSIHCARQKLAFTSAAERLADLGRNALNERLQTLRGGRGTACAAARATAGRTLRTTSATPVVVVMMSAASLLELRQIAGLLCILKF